MSDRPSRLNNMRMHRFRQDPLYEAVMTDLCGLGIITVDQLEALVNHQAAYSIDIPKARVSMQTPATTPAVQVTQDEEDDND